MADTVRETERSLIGGLSGWSWWEFHKTPDKNGDLLILHRLWVDIRECADMTTIAKPEFKVPNSKPCPSLDP